MKTLKLDPPSCTTVLRGLQGKASAVKTGTRALISVRHSYFAGLHYVSTAEVCRNFILIVRTVRYIQKSLWTQRTLLKKKFKYLHTCNNKPNFNTKYAEFRSKLSIFNRKAYYENSIILHSATGQNWLASQEQVTAHILMKCFGSYSSIRFNLITDNGHSHTSIIET